MIEASQLVAFQGRVHSRALRGTIALAGETQHLAMAFRAWGNVIAGTDFFSRRVSTLMNHAAMSDRVW